MNKVKTIPLSIACDITTGKLDSNHAESNGVYPFFTCAPDPLRINTFAFDDSVILIAGNNAQGNFHINRYNGKFNAYQRTYILTEKNGHYLDYLFYALKLELVRLKEKSQGSQTKFLTKPILENIQINEISFLDQRKIASVLSTLDAKIELNNKINTELEVMVKTLYDYWFVQFDFPNEKGKPYKSSGGEMMWSEELKKDIPSGWKVKGMKEILKKNNQKFHLKDKKHNIDTIDLSVMTSSTMCVTEKSSSDEFGTNLFNMNIFDILFGGIRPYLLKAGFAPFEGLVTGTVHSFKVIQGFDYNFALLTMVHGSVFQFAISNSKGTKMPVVGADDLLEYKVAYDENIVKKFNNLISFKEIISKNILENQKTVELRDWLLPMLMNGQVEVR